LTDPRQFWNVRLAPSAPAKSEAEEIVEAPSDSRRSMIREAEEQMEQKVYRIWSVLSTFEESSAACISDMLLHVSNGAYIDGVFVAEKFIWHVEILFGCTDNLDARLAKVAPKGMEYRCTLMSMVLSSSRSLILPRSQVALQEDCCVL
jgi:hypothetical protein